MVDTDLMETMKACKERVAREFQHIVPDREPKAELYDLIRDYPGREGKGLLAAMHKVGSIEYAVELADRLAHQGVSHFEKDLAFIPENEAKALLRQIAKYVTTRPL